MDRHEPAEANLPTARAAGREVSWFVIVRVSYITEKRTIWLGWGKNLVPRKIYHT